MLSSLDSLIERLATDIAPVHYYDGEGYGSGTCIYCNTCWDNPELEQMVKNEPNVHEAECPWRLAHELKAIDELEEHPNPLLSFLVEVYDYLKDDPRKNRIDSVSRDAFQRAESRLRLGINFLRRGLYVKS